MQEMTMTLPVTDSALIGACFGAAALGLMVMTSGGGSSAPVTAPVAVTAPAPTDATRQMTSVDAAFGAQVRAYLLQNPEVIFEAVAEFERRQNSAQGDMDAALLAANYDAIFNDGHSWVGGNPDGDITLVEFMDYKCGFCKRAHDAVKTFMEADGNVRLILKEFPILGPESELASRFAVAVLQVGGNDAYALAHDALMLQDDPVTPESLDALAQDLGLDMAEVLGVMDSETVNQILLENRMLAQRLQISGTPSFVMNSEFLRGYLPAEGLAEAAALLRE
jgi:protein-disulfide isomerase